MLARLRLPRISPTLLIGAALVLGGSGALLLSATPRTEPSAVRDGVNVPVNASARLVGDLSANNSPSLARNPRDGAALVSVNRVDRPDYGCAMHVSADAGATWREMSVPLPRGEAKCYAPDVAFGADGTLYISFVTLRGRGNVPHAAWLTTSAAGTRRLSTPVRLLGPLAFQVRLASDPRRAGRLYMTWLQASDVGLYRFTESANPIMARRSDDGGRSWSAAARVSSPSRERVVAGVPVAGAGDELYTLYLDLGDDQLDYAGAHRGQGGAPYGGTWSLVLARSADAGRTWGERVVARQITPTTRFIVFNPPSPSLAVDRARGRVYAAMTDGRLGDPDVWAWASHDGGRTFKAPVRVNDTPLRDGGAQYLPALSVAPGGRLDAVYYDRRRDPNDALNEVALQSSSDAGASFGSPTTLSDQPIDSRIGPGSDHGLADLGNRLAIVSTDSAALALWADTRSGTPQSGKQDIAEAVAAFTRPSGPSDATRDALRILAAALVLSGLAIAGRRLMRATPGVRRSKRRRDA